jgi:hypothetical protein
MLDLIHRTAYRERHVAYNRVGVQKGLPPDVATVQIGRPDDGLWWNLKRGVMPEYDVRFPGGVVVDTEMEDILDKYGMHPTARIAQQGITRHASAMKLAGMHVLHKKVAAKLKYIGWRSTLRSMLENRAIRSSAEAERLLGTKEYRDVMTRRRLRATIHYDEGW